MRAVNEADPAIETIVRSTDPSFIAHRGFVRPHRARRRRHDGRDPAPSANLRFCIRWRARSAARPCARRRPSAATCSRRRPYGDFAAALLALDATVMLAGGLASAKLPLEEFLGRRERGQRWYASVAFKRPATETFRFAKVTRVHPKGIVGPLDRRATAARERPGYRRADRLWRDGPNAGARQSGRTRARRPLARSPPAIAPALAVAADGTSPIDDAIASAWWRREILPVHLRRLLLGARPA